MRKTSIKCPKCGAEYLPAEIFLPQDFLGYQTKIIRDEGELLGYDGEDPQFKVSEEYECYECDTKFKVTATLSFKITLPEEDFKEEF